MNYYNYDKISHKLVINLNNNERVIDSSSEPTTSSDKKFSAFISPYEWECQGTIKLLDLKTGNINDIDLDINADYTPKFLFWSNPTTLFVIIGFNWGTVAVGGDLYSLNISTNKIKLLKEFDNTIQIKEVIESQKNEIILKGIRYTDDNFNESEPYTEFYKL